jgi:hypothetical protein
MSRTSEKSRIVSVRPMAIRGSRRPASISAIWRATEEATKLSFSPGPGLVEGAGADHGEAEFAAELIGEPVLLRLGGGIGAAGRQRRVFGAMGVPGAGPAP